MVGSVNKVILLGNLGRDPEIRSMQSGSKMANFSIATSKRWKDRNTQEQKEKTSWHNIVIFGDGLVDIVEKYVKKGSKVYVEGELQTRKWQDQDGQDRFTTEVVLRPYRSELTMLDSRGEGGGSQCGGYVGNQDSGGQGGYMADPNQGGNQSGGYNSPATSADLDDEIPF